MRRSLYAVSFLGLSLCGCAHSPPVTGDSRGPFDTVRGLYGGNEFNALSPEGHRYFAGEAPANAKTSTAPAAAAPVAASPAPAVEIASVPTPAESSFAIDANAFAAVFGSAAPPVKPTAAQLMQLDSLSLVAADALRIDLQKKILACRRAGDSCRLAAQ